MGKYECSAIGDPQFIEIKSISPLISKCVVKVLYLDLNRNQTFISKVVSDNLAQTLPGCPIVGHYMEEKEDFGGHDELVEFNGSEMVFKDNTFPYGFVDINPKIWYQDFDEENDKGEIVRRTYLMTEGYLWTGIYPECNRIISDGNNQSMELDPDRTKGQWTTDPNSDTEFFIINDATFTKLCVLGEDVEPCFEGGSIGSPEHMKFSKENKNVKTSLYSMMQELKNLKIGELNKMAKIDDETKKDYSCGDKDKKDYSCGDDKDKEKFAQDEKDKEEQAKAKAKKEEEDKNKSAKKDDESEKDSKDSEKGSEEDKSSDKKEEKDDKKEKPEMKNSLTEYSELSKQISELTVSINSLKQQNEDLSKKVSEYQLADQKKAEDKEKEKYLSKFSGKLDSDTLKKLKGMAEGCGLKEYKEVVNEKYIEYSLGKDDEEKDSKKENSTDGVAMTFNLSGNGSSLNCESHKSNGIAEALKNLQK